MSDSAKVPRVSIVIPIFNEEPILQAAVAGFREQLALHGISYELILAENGSSDGTVRVARELCGRHPEVRLISSDRPNYGRALRQGILAARGEWVVCEEIDLCNIEFLLAAQALLESGQSPAAAQERVGQSGQSPAAAQERVDFVVGSKLIGGASDERPLLRHAASVVYTGTLRWLLGFRGTDTHGLKAFRRQPLLPIVEACVIERDVFASELVIRAYRAGLVIREIPIRVVEMRPPSINLLRRVPNVVSNLARLTWAIRGGAKS